MTIRLIVDNLRSTHNVGSLFRTCDGLGIDKIYLCGTTPYPSGNTQDERLPHIIQKLEKDIDKTALGAQHTVAWDYCPLTTDAISHAKNDGYSIVALEQTSSAIDLQKYSPTSHIALIVGPEVTGMHSDVLSLCDDSIEIKMHGKKESFNVSVAAAIALYTLKNK